MAASARVPHRAKCESERAPIRCVRTRATEVGNVMVRMTSLESDGCGQISEDHYLDAPNPVPSAAVTLNGRAASRQVLTAVLSQTHRQRNIRSASVKLTTSHPPSIAIDGATTLHPAP